MPQEQLSHNISFELEDPKTGTTFTLNYNLFDNDFSPRWFKLFKNAVEKRNPVQKNGIFYGSALNKEEDCVAEMTQVVNTINNFIEQKNLNRQKIELVPHMRMSQDFLNDMHKRFENFRPDPDFQETPIQHTLASLNTLVHRCEGFLSDAPPGCHIEVNFTNVEYDDFKETDYKLFTPNKVFGNLYLTYGVTGVPSEAAFFSKPNDPPLPQPNYCSGCFLYFNDTYDFNRWEEAEKLFSEKYGLNVRDPKMAFGYIPLGKLITPYESREQLFEKIRTHQKIKSVKLVPKGSAEGNSDSDNWLNRVLENLGLKKKASPQTV